MSGAKRRRLSEKGTAGGGGPSRTPAGGVVGGSNRSSGASKGRKYNPAETTSQITSQDEINAVVEATALGLAHSRGGGVLNLNLEVARRFNEHHLTNLLKAGQNRTVPVGGVMAPVENISGAVTGAMVKEFWEKTAVGTFPQLNPMGGAVGAGGPGRGVEHREGAGSRSRAGRT